MPNAVKPSAAPPSTTTSSPGRILDLGDPDADLAPTSSICLVETQPGQRGHYAALSYCWGPSSPPPSHRPPTATSDIPLATLPQTFQDAVTATRSLGLRYLWIDALCIDSSTPARRGMGPVYSTARVVLAAADAADPSEGMFRRYPERSGVAVPWYVDGGRAAGVVRAELRPHERVLSPERATLNGRAWATQELVLARRVVYFTAGATVWCCQRLASRGRALWDDGVLDYCNASARGGTDWSSIVTEFSARELAFSGDRLVALEGIVDELAVVRSSEAKECVYGLWTDALATHLMWSRLRAPGSMSRPAELTEVAPTWSWASTEGGMSVMSEDIFGGEGPEVRAELAIDDGDEGAGKNRRIRVKGKLGRVELRIIEKPDPYLHPCDCEVRSEEGHFLGLAASDVGLGEGVKTAVVFCLVVTFHPHNAPGGSYLTLYLQPREDGSDHYVRIGHGMILEKGWVDQLTASELYLV